MVTDGARWAIGTAVVWGALSGLSSFSATSDLASALAFALLIGASLTLGPEALAEINRLVRG